MMRTIPCCLLLLSLAAASLSAAEPDPVDFNRDIRPLLSDTCYRCHGPDEGQRQTSMRLDTHEGAFGETDEGGKAIVAGDRKASVLYQRITSDDADLRMPPADSGKSLSPEQIELVGRWIDQGAPWRGHWSFIKPERPELPKLAGDTAGLNAIDFFARARLERERLAPSKEARKTTLIRRVTFDLTGLPPTLAEVDAFLADDSPGAYERVVDRLLNSPRYGEHMARYWLDAARYGDTHGLHLDNERSIWPYRDWVIDAFNANKPFDEFTIEQLAGDLLPNPTRDQLVATGFNRCNVTTSEGGSIAEEYRVRYAVDRVETTSTVWLGLTMGCAVCHEHKFDPFEQQEFYQLFAYFANTQDRAMDGNALLPPPTLKLPTPEQESTLADLRKSLAPIEKQIKEELAKIEYVDSEKDAKPGKREPQEYVWIEDELPPGAKPAGNSPWRFVSKTEGEVFSGDKASTRSAEGLSQHFFTAASPELEIGPGDTLFAYVYLDPENPPREIMLQFNDGSWDHRAYWGENLIEWGTEGAVSRVAMGSLPETGQWVRLEVPAAKVGLKPGSRVAGWAFTQFDGKVYWDKAGVVTRNPKGLERRSLAVWAKAHRGDKDLPREILDIAKLDDDKRNEAQQAKLTNYFVEHVYEDARDVFQPLHKQREQITKQIEAIEKDIPNTLVMAEKTSDRVPTYVLLRGQYDKPDKEQQVEPAVPEALHDLPAEATPDRLGLAKWIVSPDNPLTARVTVNRFWQRYFGVGLVKTAEDFGSQGEWPSHPALLDWLAVEFIESGWDVKHMQKLIVMSAAYRQSSRVTPELVARDPENRLLARGPRFRFDAETVRDNALALSGLLVEQIGGESVKPYQPAGLWKAVGYTNSNTANFKQDHGDALYRRSMYIFWKRTSPPPTMSIFDAPSREACTVARARTNTPLQALVLMNDVQFVEAARHFAQRAMREGGETDEERATWAFRLATSRAPDADELKTLLATYHAHLAEYQANEEAARKLLSQGESPRDESLPVAEQAAWTMLCSLILNLNETVTKG
ncbi:MAG: PSD1 and planctomycete cytochrome C domain-containing protein [Pirellulaceae bacterium]